MTIDIYKKKEEQSKWLSVYIFYAGSLNELLCLIIKPFINKVYNKYVQQYFFIRYYEDGPHIRLRLKGSPKELDHFVKTRLEKTFFLHNTRNEPISIKYKPYEPELDRYGGTLGIKLAEELFQLSSKLVLQILEHNDWNYQKAIGAALQLHLIFIYTFFKETKEIANFLEFTKECRMSLSIEDENPEQINIENRNRLIKNIKELYHKQKNIINPVLSELWTKLTEEVVFEDIFMKEWSEQVSEIAKEFKSNRCSIVSSTLFFARTKNYTLGKWSILDSYIHMTNNRLGILTQDELYIYYILGNFFNYLPLKSLEILKNK